MLRIIFPLISLCFFSTTLFAECTKDTIDFYLEKGFSQEQITKLCTQSSSNESPSYQPYQKPIVIYQEGYTPGNSSEVRKAISEFKGGIDARSVEVTEEHLNFIKRACIRAGNSPEADQRIEKCVDVAYSINRDGLRVLESGRALLLAGQESIDIQSSEIKRKHVTADPWAAFSPDIRYLLKRKFDSVEKGNTTSIPIRKTTSTSQMVNAIRTISSSTTLKKTGEHETEVAKVLDKAYVPPTEEEYIASLPTPEEVKKEKKKNKKWWNPFD